MDRKNGLKETFSSTHRFEVKYPATFPHRLFDKLTDTGFRYNYNVIILNFHVNCHYVVVMHSLFSSRRSIIIRFILKNTSKLSKIKRCLIFESPQVLRLEYDFLTEVNVSGLMLKKKADIHCEEYINREYHFVVKQV